MIIAFWSPCSSGASTVLKGIAEIASASGKFVGIIEANKQYSSLPQQFGTAIPEDKSFEKALQADDDHEMIRNYHKVSSNDIYLLALNNLNRIEDLHELHEQALSNLVYVSRNKFDLLLLDIPSSYMEMPSYQSIREYADIVVAVVDNNLNSIDKFRRYVSFYRTLNAKAEFIPVLNKDIGLVELKDLKRILGMDICAVLPYMPSVIKYGNEGQPLIGTPSNKTERQFMSGMSALYEKLLNPQTEKGDIPLKGRKNILWKFKGGK